jgi:hypothetical protein
MSHYTTLQRWTLISGKLLTDYSLNSSPPIKATPVVNLSMKSKTRLAEGERIPHV